MILSFSTTYGLLYILLQIGLLNNTDKQIIEHYNKNNSQTTWNYISGKFNYLLDFTKSSNPFSYTHDKLDEVVFGENDEATKQISEVINKVTPAKALKTFCELEINGIYNKILNYRKTPKKSELFKEVLTKDGNTISEPDFKQELEYIYNKIISSIDEKEEDFDLVKRIKNSYEIYHTMQDNKDLSPRIKFLFILEYLATPSSSDTEQGNSSRLDNILKNQAYSEIQEILTRLDRDPNKLSNELSEKLLTNISNAYNEIFTIFKYNIINKVELMKHIVSMSVENINTTLYTVIEFNTIEEKIKNINMLINNISEISLVFIKELQKKLTYYKNEITELSGNINGKKIAENINRDIDLQINLLKDKITNTENSIEFYNKILPSFNIIKAKINHEHIEIKNKKQSNFTTDLNKLLELGFNFQYYTNAIK